MANGKFDTPEIRHMGEAATTSFSISTSSDRMKGYIQIFGKGTELTMDDIVAGVKEAGFTRGVSRKVVETILEGKHGKEPVLFARGVEPQDGEDGWYEFFFRTELEKKPIELEDGSVDYQNVEWFEVVEENQKLVEYHPAGDGTPGFNIFGEKIPAKKGKDLQPIKGNEIKISDDNRFYYANMGGRIIYDDMKIEITRLFIIEELTLATGNLEFDGSVLVKGNIGCDTSLKATEDIVIDGFVEAAEVVCGGSVMFRQGMNASGEGTVKAGSYVAGKFFEAVNIECEGEIQADYFLNCNLLAKEKITVSGKKGSIAGGNAYAMQGFIARNVGNRVGLATYLRVGINDKVLREQVELEDDVKNTAKSIQQLKHARNEFETQFSVEECLQLEKYNKIVAVLESQEERFEQLERESEDMAEYMTRLRKAQIVVNNTLFEGVTCELNNQKIVPSMVNNVTVKMVGSRIAIYENTLSK